MSRMVFTRNREARSSRRGRRRLAAVAVGSALFAGSALAASPAGAASGALAAGGPGPLSCTPGKVVMVAPGENSQQISYGEFTPGGITFTPVAEPGVRWNTTGYNPLDGYLYGVNLDGDDSDGTLLYRFGDDGSVTTVGTLSPGVGTTNNGTFDDAGNFFVLGYPELDIVKKIDITTLQTTRIQLSQRVPTPDFAYVHGYLWGIGGTPGLLYRVDPNTGAVVTTTVGGLPDEGFQAGGAFAYPDGDIGFFIQTLGQLVRVELSNPVSAAPGAQVISSQATDFPSGDATACSTSITDLGLQVSSPAAAAPNTLIDFTLQITNNGPNPSSGWSLSAPIPSNVSTATTSSPGCAVAGGVLTCTGGELASGASTSVVVSLTGPAAGSVHLEGTVSANDSDANSANNVDDSTTVIAADPGTPMLDPTVGGLLLGGLAMGAGVVVVSRNRRRSALR